MPGNSFFWSHINFEENKLWKYLLNLAQKLAILYIKYIIKR